MKVVQIPVEFIVPNPEQPRKVFTDNELEELTNSIREYGVLQPLLVKRTEGKKFILIAGERRLRASKLAGLHRVPVIIKDLEEPEAALIALVENVQREDLNFLEEARAYKKLMEDFNLTQGEIAKRVSKQQSTISNKIRILALPEELQQMLMTNKLTERHARAPRYTVLSAPPAAVTAPLNAPAVRKIKHIMTTFSSPIPFVHTLILSLNFNRGFWQKATASAIKNATIVGIA